MNLSLFGTRLLCRNGPYLFLRGENLKHLLVGQLFEFLDSLNNFDQVKDGCGMYGSLFGTRFFGIMGHIYLSIYLNFERSCIEFDLIDPPKSVVNEKLV